MNFNKAKFLAKTVRTRSKDQEKLYELINRCRIYNSKLFYKLLFTIYNNFSYCKSSVVGGEVSSVLYSQEKLLSHLTTVFGDTDIVLKSLTGREAISDLFEFRIVFSAKDSSFDLEKALGSNINIAFKSDSQERYIDGIVIEFSQGSTVNKSDEYVTEYSATIRPKLWLLSLDRNNLIFQEKTAIDIIKQVLKDQGVTDIEDKTKTCGKVKREYCVQYDESSFNFISRLMEDEGIFYFFKHEKSKHTLVLADASSAHAKPPGESKVGFFRGVNDIFPLGKIFNTQMTTAVNTGGYSISDYNYTISQTNLFSKLDGKYKGKMFYEYPGAFAKLKEGQDLSKLRVQLFEFNHCLFSASSTAANITPGFLFQVTDHHVDKFNNEYVAYAVEHLYEFSNSSGFIYQNRVQAFEKKVEFRPPRKTPKPRIHGTQTATVTCPSGEEIFRNEHCCVKVHFHWDQIGKKDDKDSCWIRVAQMIAGNGWGGVFVPRIGQEVVVAFIEGDPDRPLIVGCVYNDKYLPAYSDKEAMISSLKTVTFTDEKGFNEIRFNDEKDKQEIYLHAQKDMYISIISSRKTEIEELDDTLDLFKGSRTITLQSKDGPANHSLSIKEGNSSIILEKGNSSVSLKEGNREISLDKGNSSVLLKEGNSEIKLSKGNCTITLADGNLSYDVKGNCTWKISGDLTIKADGNITIESGKKTTLKSGQDTAIQAGTALSLKGGTDLKGEAGTALSLKGGTDLKAESGTAMAIKAGLNLDASANMNMTLKANMNLECKGQLGVKIGGLQVEVQGTAMAKVSAPMITVGGGMLQLG
ncbi:MAG: type VI secretion system tip protein VgrG [Holosporaceae bacterium]|jgi:type VI secretion system secreted protein VgrG|nr:type VI secretion system tip protein VgrG [Holosporaceae bacterium]